jgi:hypothetical protein
VVDLGEGFEDLQKRRGVGGGGVGLSGGEIILGLVAEIFCSS